MYVMVQESIKLGFESLVNQEKDNQVKISKNEEVIDKLNEGIIKHITLNLQNEVNLSVSGTFKYCRTSSKSWLIISS